MAKPGSPWKKRITFTQADAAHLYEWGYAYWRVSADPARHLRVGSGSPPVDVAKCLQCQEIGERLEQFIGPGEAARLRDLVRKNP